MTAKHHTPEYQRNARAIKARVKTLHRLDEPVVCWRCRRPILPGQPCDVGHLPGAVGSALHELAPEHRHKTQHCAGNRSAGGKVGAAKTNARPVVAERKVTTWTL